MNWPKGKVIFLFSIIIVYILFGIGIKYATSKSWIEKSPPTIFEIGGSDSVLEVGPNNLKPYLEAAQYFFENNLVRKDGHVDLYVPAGSNLSTLDNSTNSEAISYYLLWAAQEKNKEVFDRELEFMRTKMLHPKFGYMMWKVQADGTITEEGSNIATDADLRAIKALMIAEKNWNDPKYTKMIEKLAIGLEKLGITNDGYLAPYAGISGEDSIWKTQEIWLSYSDFTVFEELSRRRGDPWTSLYRKMKNAVLEGQIHNGLYNSMLTERREYGNGIDAGGYSINSMWIMVRAAESNDPELITSANKSLLFYKNKFNNEAELYSMYSSNGDAMSPTDTPWVYALIGRAAIALNDEDFSDKMMVKLVENQVTDSASDFFGAFVEGFGDSSRIGQFTMQESIITMQDYVNDKQESIQKMR